MHSLGGPASARRLLPCCWYMRGARQLLVRSFYTWAAVKFLSMRAGGPLLDGEQSSCTTWANLQHQVSARRFAVLEPSSANQTPSAALRRARKAFLGVGPGSPSGEPSCLATRLPTGGAGDSPVNTRLAPAPWPFSTSLTRIRSVLLLRFHPI